MSTIDLRSIPIREPLARECARAWERLALPGTWWSGAERLAIAQESRHARQCALCRARKQALSPYTVEGAHDALGALPPAAVEAVHRITTDSGRLTRKWLAGVLANGLAEEQYVEIVGVVALITALDTFDLALGRPARALPAATAGAPTRRRPAAAKRDLAWVSTLAPEACSPADIDPYRAHGMKNIHRALSLVPQEVLNFFDLDVELYLKDHEIRDFAREYRALSHVQMEFLAARVSSLNGCYYWTVSHASLLRASGQHAGSEVRVGGALDGNGSGAGVPHAELLVEFGEAMLSADEPRRRVAREAVHAALGAAAFVDAAAVVASFNAVVKLADACGIPLEDVKAEATAGLRAELQLEKLNHLQG